MNITSITILLAIFCGITAHEYAHARVAFMMGDRRDVVKSRITLNPLKHIDAVGTGLLPCIAIATGFYFIPMWAKPVEYKKALVNKENKNGEMFMLLAGPAANIAIMLFLVILLSFLGGAISFEAKTILQVSAGINGALGFFNLVPLGPLDGAKIFDILVDRIEVKETYSLS